MFILLLSGDGTVVAESTSRAQLPLLLAQTTNVTSATVGQASETDTALPMTVLLSGAAIVQVGIATETDSALVMSVFQPPADVFLPVGLVTETDTAFPVTFVASGDVFVAIGQASETDTALSITSSETLVLPVFVNTVSIDPIDEGNLSLDPVIVR